MNVVATNQNNHRTNQLRRIRNLDGKLLCEVAYDQAGEWYILIKKGRVQTLITLMADGSNKILDTRLI